MSLSVPGVVPLTEKQSGNVAMKQSKFLTPQSEDSDGKSEDSSTFLKAPTIKTFSRKDRPNYKVLSSLSNRVTMNCGLNVSISIPDLATLPQDVSQPKQQQEQPPHKEEAWQKITELVGQIYRLF
jgi:FtsZ-interacting cell division protein ZipA